MNKSFFDISKRLLDLAQKAEEACKDEFQRIDEIARENGEKVLRAFIDNRVSASCFKGTDGYGYGDVGREAADKVYAQAFGAESALVRHNFVNGTHALSTALFGVLRPGDLMVCITGTPYDTIHGVIGIGEKKSGSLADFGVIYREVKLLADGTPDLDEIRRAVIGARVVYIQRSRGYSLRPSIDIKALEELISSVREADKDAYIVVDNCYCEFCETVEPCEVGADLTVGSLIKNPGGGIARTGGYIAGRKDLVELCADRLSCVGMGTEVGCTLGLTREILLGFFLAPQTVANALKVSCFACRLFEALGFKTYPSAGEKRADIIASVCLENEENLTAFCKGIQKGSPVDSFAVPEAWDMPGYDSKVIMAAGAFTMGASIELSADAPIREPYAVWLQGGLTYPSGRAGVLLAAREMLDSGRLKGRL